MTLILFTSSLTAQSYSALDTVIVEKYYISDANDAKDVQYFYDTNDSIIDSLKLKDGSMTYRVYIQMKPGYKLIKVFGDANHLIRISSTDNFYNQFDYGASFGQKIHSNNVYRKNAKTAGIDTWLTLGMATDHYYGILKKDDADGSILGKYGYLENNDTAAGIPLTVADGFDSTNISATPGWADFGILDSTNNDSTIFGSLKIGNEFKSNHASIQNYGVMGTDSNRVLIAQLTTKGELSFELNIQVMDTAKNSVPITFVAKKPNNSDTIVRLCLTYPPPIPICGCNDPKYVEYNPDYTCLNTDSCKTLKPIPVFGCKDPLACNYDPNPDVYSVPELCCYPGLCAGRDINIVCPDLGEQQPTLKMFPNPVNGRLTVELSNINTDKVILSIFNVFGNKIFENKISAGIHEIDMSSFVSGVYILRIQNPEGSNITKHLIKN